MPRSLLDGVDLRRLRLPAASGAQTLAACLIDGGAAQFDAGDPAWPDRDRLVAVAGSPLAAAVDERLQAAGCPAGEQLVLAGGGGEALAVALGAGAVSRLDGGVWRAWCLLADDDCDDGTLWEAVRAAGEQCLATVTALVDGAATAPLWRACGWSVRQVPAEPVRLLAAVDHAVAEQGVPAVVLTARR